MSTVQTVSGHRWLALAGALVLLALLVWQYFSSLETMWFVWGDSNTYTHGYLVFPMAAYLIWTRWDEFRGAPHQPFLWGALAIVVCGLVWVLSDLLSVHVIGQLMLVTMIVLLCVSYFGLQRTGVILFPLAYLYFAVPMGEALVPTLMDFTADFTIWALTSTGLPVYRDGMFFSIPAGDFEVAKACSGIRYLMASFALGTLYAYLSFRSFKKQLLFSLLSLLVPILANGVRAYGIVMIAHFSDMKYAVGVDHLVYGWLFFGVVMFLLFFIGGRFRSAEDFEAHRPITVSAAKALPAGRIAVAVAVLSAALMVPQLAGRSVRHDAGEVQIAARLPQGAQGWTGPSAQTTRFEPAFANALSVQSGHYQHGPTSVYVWVYRYPAFDAEREMITATNLLADLGDWSVFQQLAIDAPIDGGMPVIQTEVGNRFARYTVWHWYQLNETAVNSLIKAKLSEAGSLLRGQWDVSEALVVVAVPLRDEEGETALQSFVEAHAEVLRTCAFEAATDCVDEAGP